MSLVGKIVQGTAAALLASGAIKIVSKGYGAAKDKVKDFVGAGEEAPVAGAAIEVTSGHRGLKFATVAELPASIAMKTGDLSVDLAGVPVTADAALALELGQGTLRLKLPQNQNWIVAWSIGKGGFTAGQERRLGANLIGRNAHTPLPGAPTLTITAQLKSAVLTLR